MSTNSSRSFKPSLESMESREVPASLSYSSALSKPMFSSSAAVVAAPSKSSPPPAIATTSAAPAGAVSVPGGKVLSSFAVDAGNRRVVVAQVQVSGAEGNNRRIYASVLDRATNRPVRSNILLSDVGTLGNHNAPAVGVTTTGKVVVAWNYYGVGGSNNRIYFRMIDPAAGNMTPVLQANSSASNTRPIGNASVRAGAKGTFTIRWVDHSNYTVRAADFAPNGVTTRYEYHAGYVTR